MPISYKALSRGTFPFDLALGKFYYCFVSAKVVAGILCCAFIALCPQRISAIETHSLVKNHVYYTEGRVDALTWYDSGLAAMRDYANYRLWATRGIDGRDARSAAFWENFVDFEYEYPDMMIVYYNLNLGWPLGSKGNKARFKIDETLLGEGILSLRLIDKPIGLESAVLSLIGEDSPTTPGTKQVRFQIAIKFGWLLEILLDREKYSSHMNVLLGILVENLQDYSLRTASAGGTE